MEAIHSLVMVFYCKINIFMYVLLIYAVLTWNHWVLYWVKLWLRYIL